MCFFVCLCCVCPVFECIECLLCSQCVFCAFEEKTKEWVEKVSCFFSLSSRLHAEMRFFHSCGDDFILLFHLPCSVVMNLDIAELRRLFCIIDFCSFGFVFFYSLRGYYPTHQCPSHSGHGATTIPCKLYNDSILHSPLYASVVYFIVTKGATHSGCVQSAVTNA